MKIFIGIKSYLIIVTIHKIQIVLISLTIFRMGVFGAAQILLYQEIQI